MKQKREKGMLLKWQKFISNPLSSGSIVFIGLLFLFALFAYMFIPDKSEHANTQHLALATKKPGFEVSFLKQKMNDLPQRKSVFRRFLTGKERWHEMHALSSYDIRNDSIFIQEYTGVAEDYKWQKSFHLVDILFSVDASFGISKMDDSYRFYDNEKGAFHEIDRKDLVSQVKEDMIVKRKFFLGTDRFGRDLLSRLILGARISLSIGFIAVIISLLLGILLGSLSGYYGGWVDYIIMWFINVVWSIPTLLLVIALTMVIGKGFWQIFVAVGLTMWVEVARIVRGEVKSQCKLEYIEAARVTGLNDIRILLRHILPNIISPIVIIAASNFASAILIEAGLSFLGIGVQPPIPSWGAMIRDHYGYIIVDKAYLAFIPGLSIMLLVLSFTLIGNGLRDAFDVRG
ncbi:MAG: ABC transporter permease [Bacteroidota bacterium]